MKSHPHINAVIFDMDGLMFDTERIAQKAWQQAAAEHGYIIPEETYRRVIGRNLPDIRTIIYQHFGADFPFDRVYQRRQQLQVIYITNQGMPVKPGLIELLEEIESRSIPIAVASSSGRQVILNNLTAAGIEARRFQVIVSGDEIARGKPAPDIFLAAASGLHAAANQCVVLEDSNIGIQAAHIAGMIPVMVPDMVAPEAETKKLAYRILPDLHAVSQELFKQDGR